MNVNFFWQTFFHFLISGFLSILAYGVAVSVFSPVAAVVIAIVVALILAWVLTRRVSRPLLILNERVGRLAAGDQRRMQTIVQQKSEQDAVFLAMSEGVVALDHNQRILHMNRSAGQILGLSRAQSQGKLLIEVVRVPEVLELVRESLNVGEGRELDLELPGGSVRYLQVRSNPLTNTESDKPGLVLVLSDVTRLRELEGMRRNFVTNVSHELRTPLTLIQGFAETILNPSVQQTDEIKKFVEIIQRHALRLGRIIEDILTLSRIEKDEEQQQIELQQGPIIAVLENALELCTTKARMKQIQLSLECEPTLEARFDKYLLEQAVVNLVDNAIRYSDSGGEVKISAELVGEELAVRVTDKGIGIPEKHHARIFERFYRVDKARSREVGGTGLGLAIVKHIATAHRGRVDLQSQPGRGSTFSLIVPRQ